MTQPGAASPGVPGASSGTMLVVIPVFSVTRAHLGHYAVHLTVAVSQIASVSHASHSTINQASVPGAAEPGRAWPGRSLVPTGPASHTAMASLTVALASSVVATVTGPHYRTASCIIAPSFHVIAVHASAAGKFTYLGYEDLICFNYTPDNGGCLVLVPDGMYDISAPALFQLRGHPYFGRTDFSPSEP